MKRELYNKIREAGLSKNSPPSVFGEDLKISESGKIGNIRLQTKVSCFQAPLIPSGENGAPHFTTESSQIKGSIAVIVKFQSLLFTAASL